jgi:hypothetical protein
VDAVDLQGGRMHRAVRVDQGLPGLAGPPSIPLPDQLDAADLDDGARQPQALRQLQNLSQRFDRVAGCLHVNRHEASYVANIPNLQHSWVLSDPASAASAPI